MMYWYQEMFVLVITASYFSLSIQYTWKSTTYSHLRLFTTTQDDYMIKDQCILVDENDYILGPVTKFTAHRFSPSSQTDCPLHRAFSAFLFNQNGQLLLQKRAFDKITFPGVWSNTCCSHPLYGFEESEVDSNESIKLGKVKGIKLAAQRKLYHELGIEKHDIPIDTIKYITRIHYCAKDTVTYGDSSVWGEHEIDYVLFMNVSNHIVVNPNMEEVSEVKWVNQEEFKRMIDPASGLLWSPWFRLIAEKLLYTWWNDLDGVFQSEKYNRHEMIYRFT